MARIRIIDEWLRSPVSPPWRHRAVMVVAESWAEQRVLMRAFAACGDQTRPTIVLYGIELAIGPAGLDAHGEWGIHVEPPVDGRAQELRAELELAARRLAGSKGNPPRLIDEMSRFDNKATRLWAPGTPADLPAALAPAPTSRFAAGYYEPAEVVARSSQPMLVTQNPHSGVALSDRATTLAPPPFSGPAAPPSVPAGAPAAPAAAMAAPAAASSLGSRTQRGVIPADPGPARSAALARPVAGPHAQGPAQSFATLVGRTMPLGLQLTQSEREVLNALGRVPVLTADEVGRIASESDPVSWMERFVNKLSALGLDLVAPGVSRTGERTYALRR